MARPITVTAKGGAQITTSTSKFGGASADFNALSDHLLTPIPRSYGADFTVECWVNFDTIRENNWIFTGESQTFVGIISPGWWNGELLECVFKSSAGDSNSFLFQIPIGNLSTNQWYHFAVTKQGADFRCFLDGVRQTGAFQSPPYDANKGLGPIERISGPGFSDVGWLDARLDELRISNIARYSNNFTPQTSPHVSDANTMLLLHMDGTNGSTVFIDDTTLPPIEGSASLSSNVSLSAQGAFQKQGSASLSSVSSLTAEGQIADATGYFIPEYINEGYFAKPVTEASASLSVAATVSADVQKLRSFSASVATTFTQDAVARRIRSTDAALTAEVTTQAVNSRIVGVEATLDGAFSPSVEVNAILTSETLLQSQFELVSDVNTTVDTGGLLEFFADLNAQAAKLLGVSVSASAEFTVDAALDTIKPLGAALSSSFVLNVTTEVVQVIDLDAQSSISIDASILRDAASTLASHFELVGAIHSEDRAKLTSTFSLEATSTATKTIDCLLAAAFDITALASNQIEATVDFVSTSTLTAALGKIVVDKYVYTIPSENRTFSITQETRTHSITDEDRTFTILGVDNG